MRAYCRSTAESWAVNAQKWGPNLHGPAGRSVIQIVSCPCSMSDLTQKGQWTNSHSDALPSKDRDEQAKAPKREARLSCRVCMHTEENINFRNAWRTCLLQEVSMCARRNCQRRTHMIIKTTETTQCKPVGRQRGQNDYVGTALKIGRAQGRRKRIKFKGRIML